MAKFEIENEILKIEVDRNGAELSSMYHKIHDLEYLWPGNPKSWNGRAPILFPIIGSLPKESYSYKGESFSMPQHGFARRSEWHLHKHRPSELIFSLKESKESLEFYPFAFYLEVGYRLEENRLLCSYSVKNSGKNPLPFSIGSHTAFRVPLEEGLHFSDYELYFNREEDTQRWLQGPSLLTGESTPFKTEKQRMALEHSLFTSGSYVFKDLASDKITLQSSKGERKASITFSGFPYCTLWTFNTPQPYLCIEPWHGVTPTEGSGQDIMQKEGIIVLEAGGVFHSEFVIELS